MLTIATAAGVKVDSAREAMRGREVLYSAEIADESGERRLYVVSREGEIPWPPGVKVETLWPWRVWKAVLRVSSFREDRIQSGLLVGVSKQGAEKVK